VKRRFLKTAKWYSKKAAPEKGRSSFLQVWYHGQDKGRPDGGRIVCRRHEEYLFITERRSGMLLEEERRELVVYGKRMLADRLVTLTSGNISIYDPETGYMAVTPSGIPYDETTPQDIVVMTLDGKVVDGSRKPSSENRLHAAVYKARPHARAVVHTHSMFATTLGIAGEEVKAVHFLLPDLMGRGTVPLVPYVTYGTQALAERVREAMKDSPACLLQNHGMVASGTSLADAYARASAVETTAEMQWRAECIGKMRVLTEAEVEETFESFRTSYGQKA
jgi:L-fuculose-phosphate aldolase